MIKKIEFDLFTNKYEVNFSKGVNLIVGPKGGGKSTLLNTLACACNGIISDNLKKLFSGKLGAESPIDLTSPRIYYSSGDEIGFTTLTPMKEKIVQNTFDDNMNILSQKDSSKTALDDSKEVEKLKKKFIDGIIDNNDIRNINDDIVQFKKNIKNFTDASRENINWPNVLKVTDNVTDSDTFLKLNYKGTRFRNDIKHLSTKITEQKDKNIGIVRDNKYTLKNIQESKFFEESKLKDLANEQNILEKNINKMNSLYLDLSQTLDRTKKISQIFENSYKDIIDKLKEQNFAKDGLDSFKIEAKEHMKNMAIILKDIHKSFNKVMEDNYGFNCKHKKNHGLLTLKIDEKIEFEDDEIINLLKIYVYSSNTKTDFSKWVEQTVKKGFPESSELVSLQKVMKKILTPKIKVYAGEKDYELMSPGEKSILGMRYKLENIKEKIVFLDQPEDNLDNHTIATEVLDMLKEIKNKQIFIVTHNANIGILMRPETVIMADFSNKDNPYSTKDYGKLVKEPKAYFLEGGVQRLQERHDIIMKGAK